MLTLLLLVVVFISSRIVVVFAPYCIQTFELKPHNLLRSELRIRLRILTAKQKIYNKHCQ